MIDTGVDTDTDLGSALVGRTTVLGGGGLSDPGDFGATSDTGDLLTKHGTYVSGIVASQIDGKGTSGIWPAAKVYSARVFAGGSSAAQVDDYRNAIGWCRTRPGVRVINLSLSGLNGATSGQRALLDDTISETRLAPYGINIVAAAGNSGSSATVGYPATSGGVFAVGATDLTGALASFSNRGTGLDIATLGVDSCVTTNHGTTLGLGRGTSYAAPIVSAVIAAMRSYDPALTPDHAEALLLDNADTVGGVKVLNAAKSFRADAVIAPLATDARNTGLGAPVTNACDPPPVPAGGGGGGLGVGASGTRKESDPTNAVNIGNGADVVTSDPVPAPLVDGRLRTERPVAQLKPVKPTLRSMSFREGVLTLRISGRQRGDLVLVRVDGRHLMRSHSGVVRVRAKKWKSIRLQLQRPGVGMSPTLIVRAKKEF